MLLYFYLLLVFSFFPWTRGVAALLVNYVTEPIAGAFRAFALSVILIWPYLPSSDSTAFKGVASDRFAAAGIEIMSPAYEAHRDGTATTIPSGSAAQAPADGAG